MHGAEQVAVFQHAFVHSLQADGVGVEQRATAVAWEAITGSPDHVDVAGADGHTFLENAEGFVDERIQATLQYFFFGVLARCHANGGRLGANQLQRHRVVVAGTVALLVAVVALAVLLTKAASVVKRDIRLVVARVGRVLVGIGLVDVHAHIHAGHVEHREDAHGHAPFLERRVHLARRGAFQHHTLRFARIAFHHAITDEAIADARQHRRLAQRLGQVHGSADALGARGLGTDDFEQRHNVRRREEVHADDVLRTGHSRGQFVDVERRGIGGQHSARLRHRIELREHRLLQVHALHGGFDDDVGVAEVRIVEAARNERHALRLVLGRETAALHHRLVVGIHHAKATLQRFSADIDDGDRQAGVGEAHGNAATHGAGTHDAALQHLLRLHVGRQAGNLAGFALGEEHMHQRAGLHGLLAQVHLLGLEHQPLGQRHAGRSGHHIDGSERRSTVRIELAGGGAVLFQHGFVHRGNGEVAGAAHALAGGNGLVQPSECAGAQVTSNDSVDEAEFDGPGGIDRLGRDDHLEGLVDTDETRHALGTAGTREDAQRDFRQAEARAWRGKAVMAGQRNFHATTEYRAMHGRGDGQADILEAEEQFAVGLFLRRARELADIGTRHERVAGADHQRATHACRGGDLVEHGVQIATQGNADVVDWGVVDRDDGDAVHELDAGKRLAHRVAPEVKVVIRCSLCGKAVPAKSGVRPAPSAEPDGFHDHAANRPRAAAGACRPQ